MAKVRIFALGGLDEDGKNMYVVENGNDIFVMECGLKYPEGEQYGVQMIIPDFTWLKENEKRIKGVFITHGHDDVMAALPNLLKEMPKLPVYMAPLTAMLFERRAKKIRKSGHLVQHSPLRMVLRSQSVPKMALSCTAVNSLLTMIQKKMRSTLM